MNRKNKRQAWTPERLKQWEKTRALGRTRFIWTHGVLQWGGFMFFFSMAVFQHRHYGHLLSIEGNLPFRLSLALVVWAFVGYLYGKSRWESNEQQYLEQTR
jgi:hypothetical protein